MALGNPQHNGIKAGTTLIYERSVQSDWVVALSDATEIASASELLDIETYAGTNAVVLSTQGATSMLLRAAWDKNASGVTTNPRARVFGRQQANTLKKWTRLDNVDSAAVGIVLSCDNINGLVNGTQRFGERMALGSAIDLQGFNAIAVILDRAIVVTGAGLDKSIIQAKMLN